MMIMMRTKLRVVVYYSMNNSAHEQASGSALAEICDTSGSCILILLESISQESV